MRRCSENVENMIFGGSGIRCMLGRGWYGHLTLGASEEQVVGAVDAEHGLAVSLSHMDTLQCCCPAAFG